MESSEKTAATVGPSSRMKTTKSTDRFGTIPLASRLSRVKNVSVIRSEAPGNKRKLPVSQMNPLGPFHTQCGAAGRRRPPLSDSAQINISTVEESLELRNAGTTDGDEITCWTVQTDTPHYPEKYEQVYMLKPEVRQTTRYPPPSTPGDESSVPHHGHMMRAAMHKQ